MSAVISVDLASKFSAYCVMNLAGKVLAQGDSRDKSPLKFASELYQVARSYVGPEEGGLILLEDVPYGISSQFQTKPVLRFQGILICELQDFMDRTLFVNPSTWQRSYPGVSRGEKSSREAAARTAAEELGYVPPPLVAKWVAQCQKENKKVLKKDTNPLAKNETDYIDAYLMGRWAVEHLNDIRDLSGVQPVLI